MAGRCDSLDEDGRVWRGWRRCMLGWRGGTFLFSSSFNSPSFLFSSESLEGIEGSGYCNSLLGIVGPGGECRRRMRGLLFGERR